MTLLVIGKTRCFKSSVELPLLVIARFIKLAYFVIVMIQNIYLDVMNCHCWLLRGQICICCDNPKHLLFLETRCLSWIPTVGYCQAVITWIFCDYDDPKHLFTCFKLSVELCRPDNRPYIYFIYCDFDDPKHLLKFKHLNT